MPPTGTIRHCIDCSYDLHALPPDAPCPECGSPVWHTVEAKAQGNDWQQQALGSWFGAARMSISHPHRLIASIAPRAAPKPDVLNACLALGFSGFGFGVMFSTLTGSHRYFVSSNSFIIGGFLGTMSTFLALVVLVLAGSLVLFVRAPPAGQRRLKRFRRQFLGHALFPIAAVAMLSFIIACIAMVGATIARVIMMSESGTEQDRSGVVLAYLKIHGVLLMGAMVQGIALLVIARRRLRHPGIHEPLATIRTPA